MRGDIAKAYIVELHSPWPQREWHTAFFSASGLEQTQGALERRCMLLERFRQAGEPIDGVVEFVEVGDEHYHITRSYLMFQHLPPAEAEDRGLTELTEQRLPEEIAIRQAVPLQVGAIRGARGGAESLGFTSLRSAELHSFYRSQRVLNTCRHFLPEAVVLRECRL